MSLRERRDALPPLTELSPLFEAFPYPSASPSGTAAIAVSPRAKEPWPYPTPPRLSFENKHDPRPEIHGSTTSPHDAAARGCRPVHQAGQQTRPAAFAATDAPAWTARDAAPLRARVGVCHCKVDAFPNVHGM